MAVDKGKGPSTCVPAHPSASGSTASTFLPLGGRWPGCLWGWCAGEVAGVCIVTVRWKGIWGRICVVICEWGLDPVAWGVCSGDLRLGHLCGRDT